MILRVRLYTSANARTRNDAPRNAQNGTTTLHYMAVTRPERKFSMQDHLPGVTRSLDRRRHPPISRPGLISVLVAGFSLALYGQTDKPRRPSADTAALAKLLQGFRGRRDQFGDPLGLPAAQLARIKKEYLHWIDSRIAAGAGQDDINNGLSSAGLFERASDSKLAAETVFPSYMGFLEEVTARPVRGAADLLEVRLGVGTLCNYDQTIAIYSRSTRQRVGFVSTSNDVPNEMPVPTRFSSAAVGPEDAAGHRLLAIGGYSAWCTSTIISVSLRVEDIVAGTMQTLLNRVVGGRCCWDDSDNVTATVVGSTVEFRYHTSIFDGDITPRPAIARFSRSGSGLQRDAPLALSRAGYIDEWLKMDDAEAARWSTINAAQQHATLAAWGAKGFRFEQIARCPGSPPVWQVVLRFDEPQERRAFILTGSSPNEMRILGVSREPRADCREAAKQELTEELK